jgi:hypothetical protein
VDLSRLPVWMLLAASVMIVGCSSAKDPHRLSTRSDASRFVADVARGGELARWQLASGASSDATRVWSERSAIQDMGSRLRHTKAPWACEFAEDASVLYRFGKFSVGDRYGVSTIARNKGAKPGEIRPLLNDVLQMTGSDLAQLTTAACGNP